MADRNKGTFVFSANFQVKMQELLDPRGGVQSKSELINKETFPYDGDTIYMKEGMLVTVTEEQSAYMLIDLSKILETDYSGWKRIDAGAAEQVEIVDNLTSTSTTSALSANQGKVLMDFIDALQGKVSSIYTPKGSKAFAELPTEGNNVGDVYNITDAFTLDGKPYPAGTNVAWTGTAWDALGGWVDFSNYYTKEETGTAINGALDTFKNQHINGIQNQLNTVESTANTASSVAAANRGRLDSLESTVGTINLTLTGNPEVEGDSGVVGRLEAVEELIGSPTAEDKSTTMLSRLNALEELVTGGEGGGEGETDQTLLQKVNQNTLDIATLKTTVGDTNSGLVKAVNTLNGDASTVGSVDYKIAEAIADAFEWIDVQ